MESDRHHTVGRARRPVGPGVFGMADQETGPVAPPCPICGSNFCRQASHRICPAHPSKGTHHLLPRRVNAVRGEWPVYEQRCIYCGKSDVQIGKR